VWWRCPKGTDHEWQAPVDRRTSGGSGCPFCRGLKVSISNSLASVSPTIAAEWHPTKNGDITPDKVVAGSNKKFWWKCPNGEDHQWQAAVCSRTARENPTGCPYCSNRRVSEANSLAACFGEIAAEWHPTKNGDLTPDRIVAGSNEKVWWRCSNHPDHDWQSTVVSRTAQGSGCPFCVGQRVSVTNSLASRFPEIAAQWHWTKNDDLTPEMVVAGTDRMVWWKCPEGLDHEWQSTVSNRTTSGQGCPCCSGLKVSVTNSLTAIFPEIAAEWHPTKNEGFTPDQVTAGTHQKVWWKCIIAPDHEWEATVVSRTSGSGCPFCSGNQVSTTNSLASLYPDVAAHWHPTKNRDFTPDQVTANAHRMVWWMCPKGPDHEWEAPPSNRVRNVEGGCPFCRGLKVSVTNSLASRFPEIAAEWHPTKNENVTPQDVVAGSGKRVWWQCCENLTHVWQATVNNRTNPRGMKGCPYCNSGWTVAAIRHFVSSLMEHLQNFTPAELYLLFQQNGLLSSTGKGRAFVKALVTGRFPKEEIDKFVNGAPSLVDEFVQDPTQTLETLEMRDERRGEQDDSVDLADELVSESQNSDPQALPVVEAKSILASLSSDVVTSADEEAVEFLIASGIIKIWQHAYQDEAAAVGQAEAFSGEGYAEQVKNTFLEAGEESGDSERLRFSP